MTTTESSEQPSAELRANIITLLANDLGAIDAVWGSHETALPHLMQTMALELIELQEKVIGLEGAVQLIGAFVAGAAGLKLTNLIGINEPDEEPSLRRGAYARGFEIREAAGADFGGDSLESTAEAFDHEDND